MALRDTINTLLTIHRRDPDDIALREFMIAKLEEFDTAKAAVEENQRVEALHNPQPQEGE